MSTVTYVSEMEKLLETALTRSKQDMYGVYRLKDIESLRARKGKSFDELVCEGIEIRRNDYFLCYIGPLGEDGWIDNIRQQLSQNKPLDFPGASPDIGDIIILQIESSLTAHYLGKHDSFDIIRGFMESATQRQKVIAVIQTGVIYGSYNKRTVPGYILENGAILFDMEQDAAGNYYGSVGADGMYLKTGKIYRPVIHSGKLIGFFEV